MPLSQIDPVAALVVIDLQKGIVGLPMAHSAGEIVSRSALLAHAFRKQGWPVVLVNVAGRAPGRTDAGAPNFSFPPNWTELVAELDQQPEDYLITKHRPGAFLGTALDEILRQRSVTQIFVTGVATSVGVESTARSAYDLGYNVVLVVDAMTDRDAETHLHCVEKRFPRLGENVTTNEVLARLNDTQALRVDEMH